MGMGTVVKGRPAVVGGFSSSGQGAPFDLVNRADPSPRRAGPVQAVRGSTNELGNIPTRRPDVRLVVKRSDEHFMEMRDRPEPSPLRAEPIQAARGTPMNAVTVLARRPAMESRFVLPRALAIRLVTILTRRPYGRRFRKPECSPCI